jgi:WD40 repeat protein
MARVDIKSVRKTYDGANFAVNDVSIKVSDGELVATLAGHEGAVLNVRYNAGGQYALSCGKDRTLRLWSLSKGALIKAYAGHGHEVRRALGPRAGCRGVRRAAGEHAKGAQTLLATALTRCAAVRAGS